MVQKLAAYIDESISSSETTVESSRSGPFSKAAGEVRRVGLAVIPCGGEDGKVPLVAWGGWTKPPGRAFVEKMVRRHPHANVGIVTGRPSGVSLIDCDDPGSVAEMIERCGDTPLKTRTPSGGTHLWYRYAGEASGDLRGEGLDVDVRGDGGIAIVPPSERPTGLYAGCTYEFIEGSWNDLTRLPTARPGSLPMADDRSSGPIPLRTVRKGRRNRTLFSNLLHEAKHCDDIDALRDVAERINSTNFETPLTATEVDKTTRSAWGYQERGENWVGKEPLISLTPSMYETLAVHAYGSDGWFLLPKLWFSHWNRDEFAAAPKAMAKACVIPGWSHQRYRNALKALVETGILIVIHQGGERIGDAHQFAFAACLAKGTGIGPNITKHLPPSLDGAPARLWPQESRPLSPARTASSVAAARRAARTPMNLRRQAGGSVQLDLIELLGGPPAPRRIDDPVLFGSAAREARIARNLTQAKAAALAGISRSALSNIETGTFPAGLGTQVRLMAALGLPLAS